jgi:hypothetical protein
MYDKTTSFFFNLRVKVVFSLSILFFISLSGIFFVPPSQALYIDNSTHINSRIKKSTNDSFSIAETETISDGLKISENELKESNSKQSEFSLIDLIEIVSTAIITGLGVKFFASDRLLNSSKTIKELRGRIEDIEEVIVNIEK